MSYFVYLQFFLTVLYFVSVLHTSASLALNESWDPDVRDDMEMMLNKIVPEVSTRSFHNQTVFSTVHQ